MNGVTVADQQHTSAVTALPGAVSGESGSRPRWERATLLGLLTLTAVLYLWALGSAGWANNFYAAAVQAGTQSWKAWLFGSLDPGNAITVDKPPAALWVMVASARLFGFSSWSMLAPQAAMGVGAVALLHSTVRRWNGPTAALLSASVLALTPVAALMFRYNNPDALLVLLLVAAAYCTVRATETAATRWMVLAGTVIGLAFLTKLLQAILVAPALALVFVVAAPGSVRSRLAKLLAGVAALMVSAGWFVALVSMWPASSRPYIGGSSDNSLLQLALGYNGVDRVVGGGDRPHWPGFGGPAGITRLFGTELGTEASWLLPAALIGMAAVVWMTARAPRADRLRASLLLWGGWLLVTGAVFSFMNGTIHPYYTVALAPAIAALVGISVRELWRRKAFWPARLTLAVMSGVTGAWAFVLLDRTPQWLPPLRWAVLIASLAVVPLLTLSAARLHYASRAAVVAVVVGLAAPAAYTIDTVAHAPRGGLPTSGPHTLGGGPGGPGGDNPADNAVLQSLIRNVHTRWAAATVSAMTAGPLELETGTSVMAIGGFSGRDPSPTLAQFRQYVADHQIHYFITGGRRGRSEDPDSNVAVITSWVQQHFTPINVAGTTIYDLTTLPTMPN